MNKLRGLSLFCGAGVAEALLNDVKILLANEIDDKRAKFYSHIYNKTRMLVGDIRIDYVKRKIVKESKKLKVNFIIATPPCQGMSEAGKRNILDERNQLIVDTVDIIKLLEPDFILIENVARMMKTLINWNGRNVLIPEYIREELQDQYNINEENLVRAADHGVPQMRKRYIFLMTKKEIDLKWDFPEKQKEITLEKAISHLPSLDPLLKEGIDLTLEKFPNYYQKREAALEISKWHHPPVHSWKQVEWMMHTPTAKSAIYNDVYFPKKENNVPIKAHHNNYRRMDWNKPARTMTQNNGVISSLCCVHPGRSYKTDSGTNIYSDPRVLSIYELLIVSSLPLNWSIPDWANDNFIRKVIGEGIPPLLTKNIISSLLNQLKG